MKRSSPHPLVGGPALVLLVSALTGCDQGQLAAEPVKEPALPVVAGFFGFPDAAAVVLHRSVDLQVSVSNDADNLYVQALVLADGDDRLGETDEGRSSATARSCGSTSMRIRSTRRTSTARTF